jgi:hypothetical protein
MQVVSVAELRSGPHQRPNELQDTGFWRAKGCRLQAKGMLIDMGHSTLTHSLTHNICHSLVFSAHKIGCFQVLSEL